MADGATESVDVKLPTGEMITAVVPIGWSDAQIHSNLLMKRPDLFAGAYQKAPGGSLMNAGVEAQASANMPPATQPLASKINALSPVDKLLLPANRAVSGAAPALGTVAGGMLGSVEPGAGNIVGAGLGRMLGEQTKRIMQAQPTTNIPALTATAGAGATGAASEMGGQILGKVIGAVAGAGGKVFNRLSGASKAVEEAESAQAAAQAERESAHNANVANYMKASQKIEETNAAKQAQYTQDLAEAKLKQAGARRADIETYNAAQAKIDAAKARVLPAAPGEQQSWRELNEAIGAGPKSIKGKAGISSLGDLTSNPGRGLANEGFDAQSLSKLSPVEQSAILEPRIRAAGQAVDDVAAAATKNKITLDVEDKLFSVFNDTEEPINTKLFDDTMEAAKKAGITDFKNVTPTQAVAFRQELASGANFKFSASESANNLARSKAVLNRRVSETLKEAVPQMKVTDQHYSDLKRAEEAITSQVREYATNPTMSAPKGLPADLTSAKITNVPMPNQPTPITMKASPYKPLPSVPDVNRTAIMAAKNKALRNTLIKAVLAGGLAGAGEEVVRRRLAQ